MIDPNSTEEPELLEQIAEALESMKERGSVDVDSLSRGNPHWKERIQDALSLARKFKALQRASWDGEARPARLGDRYVLKGRLGAGAMGVVHLAFDEPLKREVAIKVLRSDFLTGPQALARFQREAEVLAALSHPSIVTLHDRGTTDEGSHYLVMERLEGASLADVLEHASLLATQRGGTEFVDDTRWLEEEFGIATREETNWLRCVVRWMIQLAAGLQLAHEASVLHRDVKPSNVFVQRDGRVCLLDFGIAARSNEQTLATHSATLGTPAYMAPEQLAGTREPTPAVDVYGLAATLYTALTFRPPYVGTISQILNRMQRLEPPRAVRHRPGLPRDLQAILDKGMAPRAAARYASCEAFASDLSAWLEYRPVVARPITAIERWARRLRRSTAFRAAFLTAALVLLAWGVHTRVLFDREEAARAARQERENRVQEHERLQADLRVGLSLSANPSARRIPDERERARISQHLDRLVDHAIHPIPSRVRRAIFRVDHGDVEGAREDVLALASELAMPNAAALLGMPWVEEEGVEPSPERPLEHHLAGVGLLRRRHSIADRRLLESALRHFDHPGLREHLPSRELWLLHQLDHLRVLPGRAEKLTGYRRVAEECLALAASREGHTNTTLHVLGNALSGQGRDEEAVEILREACSRDPGCGPSQMALGYTLMKLAANERGELYPEAEEALRAALRARPDWERAHELLVALHADRGDFDAALDEVERIPYGEAPRGEARRHHRRGVVHLRRAVEIATREGLTPAEPVAAEAFEEFQRGAELGHGPTTVEFDTLIALRARRLEDVALALVTLLQQEPTHWGRLHDLIEILPNDLDPKLSIALREYLAVLAEVQAPRFAPHERTSPPPTEHPPLEGSK